jgi:hypothetical protein
MGISLDVTVSIHPERVQRQTQAVTVRAVFVTCGDRALMDIDGMAERESLHLMKLHMQFLSPQPLLQPCASESRSSNHTCLPDFILIL